jgi:dTDP-glucose 4,6-dehydratase
VRAYHHTFGLNVTISNCSNNYGPYHLPEKLIPLMIINILEGKSLPMYGDGRNVRDWLHVTDHCLGIELVLEKGRVGEVYNIGGRSECENIELVKQLCSIADETFSSSSALRARYPNCPAAKGTSTSELVSFVKDRAGHDRRYAIDCGKAERELGFSPMVGIEKGLRGTLEWFVENEAWVRQVKTEGYAAWVTTNYSDRARGASVR